jgi:putative ABC transport system permease protein
MNLPLQYTFRHLRLRWRGVVITVLCVALVVAVFVMLMAMAGGLTATYVASGDERNLIVMRKGALGESSSQVTIENVRQVKFLEGIARNDAGEPLAAAEIVVLITLRRGDGGKAHVQMRGIGPASLALRPTVRMTEGRMFEPGRRQCVVSRNLLRRYPELAPGRTFRTGKHAWTVTGIFDAGGTAYDSEIWMDADEARDSFNRAFYGTVLMRPADEAAAKALAARIDGDKQWQLRAVSEAEYFAGQTKSAGPVRAFGLTLALIMSLGAAFSAMNAMYAVVGNRAREIGTLRVLGFRRSSIYLAFMLESLLIAALGGVLGGALALPMNGFAAGAFNATTFAEVTFQFRITPALLGAGAGFGVLIGLAGGLLPARLAARRPILEALRDS